jgi:hypothetical protein
MEKIIIFGTGSRAEKVMKSMDLSRYKLVAYLDNNEKKQGTLWNGIIIKSPKNLEKIEYDKIVICSTAYDAIFEQLTQIYNINPHKIANNLYFIRNKLLEYYKSEDCDEEIQQILNYLNDNDLNVFNYDFVRKYKNININVFYDESVNMFYILNNGKRMYFSSKYNTKESVIEYYRFLQMEQDINSPHCYLYGEMQVTEGDIVVDAGVAEGNFALDVIDMVSKIYLIEMDLDWIKALKETFKEYEDKVVIISKCLSDIDDESNITLDKLLNNGVINFLKMDIEGYEMKALKGANKIFKRDNPMKLDICAYHNHEDYNEIMNLLKHYNFSASPSNGYMYFVNESMYEEINPCLVRGLVRGYKV